MPKLDAYLRSIEKFGATGAILTSNQAITLRFPTGDRHATQVTPHDQLVPMLREVATPPALELIDSGRPARFEYDRYAISVVQRAGAWLVTIEAATMPPQAATRTTPPAVSRTQTPIGAPVGPGAGTGAAANDLFIERTQYDAPVTSQPAPTTSGSTVLDELTRAARNARASDVFLTSNAVPMHRVDGQLATLGQAQLAGDQISRELGLVAPPEARAAWSERGAATFGYGDGAGRIRVTLGRDQRGPVAALRLLPGEPPQLDLRIDDWLDRGGLVLVAGASGSGKTIAFASIVRALAEHRRRVIAIEDPIELVHVTPWVSQREVGIHVASVAAGISHAMREGADAIAVGTLDSSEAAVALVDAIAGNHFVVTTIVAPVSAALDRFIDLLPTERRERGRLLAGHALLGTVACRGNRSVEVIRPERRA